MTYGSAWWGRGGRQPSEPRIPQAEQQVDWDPVDVAIVCESTYPYVTGGLSAVVHQICEANPDARIGIIHIAWDRDSPSEPLYDIPPQVRWVMPVYQSLAEHAATFQRLRPRDMGVKRKTRGRIAQAVVEALAAHLDGDDAPLWRLYDDGINPLTRRYLLWPVIGTVEFMDAATSFFAGSGLTFTELFWNLREFFSLTYAVTDRVFPEAAIYHAHTTGAAAMLAAAAARQHDAQFLLTEHNLYARDTINHLLDRSMDTVVTADEWRTLQHYPTIHPGNPIAEVTPAKRAWMAWWVRTGIVAYRAARRITYLYPDAIDEARGLGGDPSRSLVLPNGVTPEHFDEARALFRGRQERARDEPHRIWKLAYAARVVPIKGLLDLLESMALLVQGGIVDWELDVMGPDGEMPDYAALCRGRCTELGLDGHVRFLGSVNLRERFGHYDALILPSHNEGQPIVVLEAMTMGLPTIGTYVGGMKQLVEDPIAVMAGGQPLVIGPCGSLVDSHDVVGLAREIAALMASPDLFDEFSRNAELRVQQYFHIDTAMGLYRDLYAALRGEVVDAPVTPVREIERTFVADVMSGAEVVAEVAEPSTESRAA
jgi:glycosyltransferase involved in cell wall biosynthesis